VAALLLHHPFIERLRLLAPQLIDTRNAQALKVDFD